MAGFQLPSDQLALPVSFKLAADFSTPVTFPIYAVVFSLPITTNLPESRLRFVFTSNWFHTGPSAVNAAVNFIFFVDGVLVAGGTTDNKFRGMIGNVARTYSEIVTRGPHTVRVEVTKFGGGANTTEINVASLPDLFHLDMELEEVRSKF